MTKTKNTKKKEIRPTGKFKEFWKSTRGRRLRGSCYMMIALFATVATVSFFVSWPSQSNWLGRLGYLLANFLVQNTFGVASLGFSFLLFLYGVRLWGKNILPWRKSFWASLFWMLWTSTALGYLNGMVFKSEAFGNYAGITGRFIAEQLHALIRWGVAILLLFSAIVVLVFIHRMRIRLPHLPTPKRPKAKQQKQTKQQNAPLPATDDTTIAPAPSADLPAPQHDQPQPFTFDIDDEYARQNQPAQEPSEENPPSSTEEVDFTITGGLSESGEELAGTDPADPEPGDDADKPRQHFGIDDLYNPRLDLRQYQMPTTDLLSDWEVKNTKVTKEELVSNKDHIVETLRNYGIEIVQITATPGPTVTLYEIKPAPGVRISKIKNLEDDIALSLSALGIRIIAPIPGKGTVGIEVPNAKPQIVSMKNMLECDAFVQNSMELPIAFGKTISNEPFVTDLAKMPHLLMAGATGTGKSVGLNAVIASLLFKKHPSELKFVMVDPKKVELSLYNKIERHYLAKLPDSDEAIITEPKKVVRTLNSLCIEMDQRYDLLRQAGVRKISEYNEKFVHRHLNPENGHRYLPYIVLIIDEFADLIMTSGKEVELPICRLAQLARAVGIHLIIATQRPTTNIITGTIKANFPARVAFKVTSGIDSRTILDCSGAQRLIGRGDMLISLSGSDLVRLQCALIETEEIALLADFIGTQRGYPDGFLLPEYLDENEEPNKDFDPKQKDEFFNDAARLVVRSQFGSTSLLQRKLQLGYNRAGRIIDQLEAAGIVGPYNGSKAREVLVHDEIQLEEILRTL